MSNVHVARIRRMLAVAFICVGAAGTISAQACASHLWGDAPVKPCGPLGNYYDGGGCCMANELLTPDGLCVAEFAGGARDAGAQ